LVSVLDVINSVTQGSRRALLDRIDYLLNRCAIRINPGFFLQLENRSKIVSAISGMGTNSTVVVDSDLFAEVVSPFVQSPIRPSSVREAILSMGTITKRLVVRAATAA
jgi:hypothetical protein